jgi:dynein heavy chain, axonemal
VKEQLSLIKTGEDAISFFAKYGNSTPIKFIHCLLDEKMPTYNPSPEKLFRPYDLTVIHAGDNQKELTHDDYYTISAHGIVHVFTERSKKSISFLLI